MTALDWCVTPTADFVVKSGELAAYSVDTLNVSAAMPAGGGGKPCMRSGQVRVDQPRVIENPDGTAVQQAVWKDDQVLRRRVAC